MSLRLLLPEDGVTELLLAWPDEPRVYERGKTALDETFTGLRADIALCNPPFNERVHFLAGCLRAPANGRQAARTPPARPASTSDGSRCSSSPA